MQSQNTLLFSFYVFLTPPIPEDWHPREHTARARPAASDKIPEFGHLPKGCASSGTGRLCRGVSQRGLCQRPLPPCVLIATTRSDKEIRCVSCPPQSMVKPLDPRGLESGFHRFVSSLHVQFGSPRVEQQSPRVEQSSNVHAEAEKSNTQSATRHSAPLTLARALASGASRRWGPSLNVPLPPEHPRSLGSSFFADWRERGSHVE